MKYDLDLLHDPAVSLTNAISIASVKTTFYNFFQINLIYSFKNNDNQRERKYYFSVLLINLASSSETIIKKTFLLHRSRVVRRCIHPEVPGPLRHWINTANNK